MKKNLALLLAVVLVLSSMFALGTVAGAETESAAPSLEIAYFNVSFKTNVSLLFAVPADEYNVKADGTVEGLQLLVWKTGKSDGTYSMADATKNGVMLEARGVTQINGVSHIVFSYSALSAAEMCETVYARLLRHDSEGYRAYSEIYDYSIAEFVNGYLNSTNPLHNQKELVSDMMDYGSAVAEYSNLVDKTSYLTYDADVVKALKKVTVNAVLNGDVVATSKQLVKSGEVSSLVVPVVNGAEFKSWSDNASGGKVNVTADTTVTATYTNKIVSSYNIESSSVGAYVSSNAVNTAVGSGKPTVYNDNASGGTDFAIGYDTKPNISNSFNLTPTNYAYSKYLVMADDSGNKYVKVSHNGASQLNFGKFQNTGIADTVGFTFSIDIMAGKDGSFPPTDFQIDRIALKSVGHAKDLSAAIFSLYADGSIKLAGDAVKYGDINTNIIVGAGDASTDSFQRISVYVDFAEARIYGYLDGKLKAVTAFTSFMIPDNYLKVLNQNRFQMCMFGANNWKNDVEGAKQYIAIVNGVETPVYENGAWNPDAIEAYVDANLYFCYDNVELAYGKKTGN